MKKISLFVAAATVFIACNDQAKVQSAATDSAATQQKVVAQPAQTKEVHYVNSESTAPVQKKGWSGAAKGAVIGGATGAVAGAVIDKKHRGRGAVIGAAVGAGAGFIIGKRKDKKKRSR